GLIQKIDVVSDRMAVARVVLHFEDATFNDFLTLFKVNGQWKIVHKTFLAQGTADRPASPYGAVLLGG
ncbi:MAG: nuclear transport factor 2 family protein, partial [Phycisphaerae bacterium]|nr:nuclear transport factor 2 family protein [Phycisphaerae bacterium]